MYMEAYLDTDRQKIWEAYVNAMELATIKKQLMFKKQKISPNCEPEIYCQSWIQHTID